jgi:hypothetical protein|tara:strand:+ start:874 stop:1110 length:237 start_codon:yes stop_codon:yes gene_type:complete
MGEQTKHKTISMTSKKQKNDKWIELLISCAKEAVDGYEKYLLDKINYQELAVTMTRLRNAIASENRFIEPTTKKNKKD